MAKTNKRDIKFPGCPIRHIIARFSDKWSILVLLTLDQHKLMRFVSLRKNIPDISPKMLTTTLKTLEEDGLVRRHAYAEVPPRVEYSLTERAASLMPHVLSLISWAKENMDDILSDRESYLGRAESMGAVG